MNANKISMIAERHDEQDKTKKSLSILLIMPLRDHAYLVSLLSKAKDSR